MKTTTISILSVLILVAGIYAKPLENPPTETNAIWRLSIHVDISPEILAKVYKKRFFAEQSFFFFVTDGEIRVNTGSYNPHLSKQFGFSPISAFVSISDQRALFTNICNIAKSSRCVSSSVDLPPIEETNEPIFSVQISINGEDWHLRCKPSDHKSDSPCQVCHVMALLRRNLPSSFDSLFDYLNVKKLPELANGKSNEYGYCAIHNEPLKLGSFPVAYGLITHSEKYSKAQSKLFPNARTSISGGCVVHPGRKTTGMAIYCESCRKAEVKWRKDNPNQ